jgi:hypothetical protein
MGEPSEDGTEGVEYLGLGIALGAGLGVVFGQLLFDDLAIGIAIGTGIGLTVGSGLMAAAQASGRDGGDGSTAEE